MLIVILYFILCLEKSRWMGASGIEWDWEMGHGCYFDL